MCHPAQQTLKITIMEDEKLIENLNEYIKWNGLRDSKMDNILPIMEQEHSVQLAMKLLRELT